ncbi:hypothetical protein ACFQMA_03260 [Halosimplex aquaticum]|uniref:Uncharacterized protein n=1 Tax=Halosimplex aquaticum TaxID=3026162 RepID=A0ABD5XUQ9_9EURY|nr:hypothetical protein [Halosimplex aquaticum]
MAPALSRAPTERIRRVDVFAYVLGLMGPLYIGDFLVAAFAGTATTFGAGLAVIGGFALFVAAHMYRNPDAINDGTEPAPAYLYVLPVVSTGAFLVLAVGWVTGLA